MDKEIEQVKKMWEQGFTATQISRVLPYKEYVTKAEIRQLKKEGILPPHSITEIRNKTICKEFEKNKNLREISEKFGVSIWLVRNVLGRCGVKHPRIMNFTPNEKKEQIIEDLENGMTMSEIAKNHGVSRQYVHQIKKELYNG